MFVLMFRVFTVLFEVVFQELTDCLPPPTETEKTAPWRHHKQVTRESIVGYHSPPNASACLEYIK